jgi:hypothetical protein
VSRPDLVALAPEELKQPVAQPVGRTLGLEA